ncbi:MAG: endonuclease/exonuclease/phosphatase family protein [Armatimonadota bacterium]
MLLASLALIERGAGGLNWFATLLLYMPQQIFAVPLGLLLILSACFRDRLSLAVNGAALLVIIFPLMGFNIPKEQDSLTDGWNLRVMTCNIHHSSMGIERIRRSVEKLNPDVLCLQEANSISEPEKTLSNIRQVMPGCYSAEHEELVILSRYPLSSTYACPMGADSGRAILKTTAGFGGRSITIFNTHLNVATGGRSLGNGRTPLSEYMRHSADIRRHQVKRLLELAEGTGGDVIITGDFNNPPRGLLYRRICTTFRDAYRSGGRGFGYTFRSDLPVMRIDYIFTTPRIRVSKCFVPRRQISDHRPVAADILVP